MTRFSRSESTLTIILFLCTLFLVIHLYTLRVEKMPIARMLLRWFFQAYIAVKLAAALLIILSCSIDFQNFWKICKCTTSTDELQWYHVWYKARPLLYMDAVYLLGMMSFIIDKQYQVCSPNVGYQRRGLKRVQTREKDFRVCVKFLIWNKAFNQNWYDLPVLTFDHMLYQLYWEQSDML